MTVHCIDIVSSKDVDSQKVKDKVADLKSKYGEKLPKQEAPFTLTETIDGTEYYRGLFCVTLTDKETEKNDLTEQIEKELSKSADWWRVKWHECVHDADNPGNCSWGYINSEGSVPGEV